MRAGQLSERVTLLQRSTATDAAGQDTITWAAWGTVWARCLPLRSVERFAAAQVQQDNTVKFHVRVGPPVNTTWRLEHNGLGYDVTGVIPVGSTHLELLCIEGQKDGR